MSYSSDITKKRILKKAKAEFLAKGFIDANLRDIAKNAKVTTGAMYNHFKNKHALFEALVEETAQKILQVYNNQTERYVKKIDFLAPGTVEDMQDNTVNILDFIYSRFDEIKLLFFLSAGTKYEGLKDRFIEAEETSVVNMLEFQGTTLTEADRHFVHIIASSSVAQLLEVVEHNLNIDDAREYAGRLNAFHYAGWVDFLKERSN